MSLKRILALASGGAGDASVLACAAWLAGRHDASAEIIPIYPDSAVDMITLGMALGAALSPDALEEVTAAERALQDRIEQAARLSANAAEVVYGAGEGAPRLCVHTRGLRPSLALSRQAALSDLVLIAEEALREGLGMEMLGQALLSDRLPLLVARGEPGRLADVVAIAWDGSAQAGRAVRAAVPLLAQAATIHVLQCVTALDRQGADPDIHRLNAYLALHGVGAAVATLVEGHDPGAALIAAAESRDAGLLVAGAWGHSRLSETIFGGATRSFLDKRDGPSLLLAH